jgi:predicted AAA+ superfamily ATPase
MTFFFTSNNLNEKVDYFYKQGGKILVLDEVHKYNNWTQILKNIYDFYPELKIVFSGSSVLELNMQKSDLSRRAIMYELSGMSFRHGLKVWLNNITV